ncbi:MAG: AAA family ATPase [Mycoplasmatales bacterium]
MIKKISFENILTFKEKQFIEFNLKEPINVIYGKNAAGKTNFLTVLRLLQKAITVGVNAKTANNLGCKFSDSSIIFIEVLLEINANEINYGFEFCTEEEKYLNEILIIDNQLIFESTASTIHSDVLTTEQVSILKNYDFSNQGVMKFITDLNTEDLHIRKVLELKQYFQLELKKQEHFKYLLNNPKLLEEVIGEMKKIDVDVDDIIIRDNSNSMLEIQKEITEQGNIPNEVIEKIISDNIYQIYFVHEGIEIELGMESTGTRQYFEMVVSTIVGQAQHGEYIHDYDEIEKHFHDELLKSFFEFFKEKIKGQLICTTHNQMILDEKLIGKENILFVDKNKNSSEIYRLSSFEGIRGDNRHNWKKLYNDDRFGAFPQITR